MQDTVKRTIRTFLQAFVATFAFFAIPAANNVINTFGESGDIAIDLHFFGKAAIAGCLAGAIALVTFVWNALEDTTGHTGLK